MKALRALLLVGMASADESAIYVRCGSRAAEGPFLATGVPVQFVHVPKCAGETVESSLFVTLGAENNLTRHYDDSTSFEDGGYYVGHRSLGWGSERSELLRKRPFFVAVLREPIARLISLFDAVVVDKDDTRLARALQQREAHLLATGTPRTGTMDAMVRNEDDALLLLARKASQFAWFVPEDEDASCEALDAFAIALNNLLRVDAVATTENLLDLAPQLHFHAPHLSFETLRQRLSERMNVARRPKQILSANSTLRLRELETVAFDVAFHRAAQALSATRTARALFLNNNETACCDDDDWCPVQHFPLDAARLLRDWEWDDASSSCGSRIPDTWRSQDDFYHPPLHDLNTTIVQVASPSSSSS